MLMHMLKMDCLGRRSLAMGAFALLSGWVAVAPGMALARQCQEPVWTPTGGLPGVDWHVYAITEWDPDGEGPRGKVIVAGGGFTIAGEVFAQSVAAFDPQTNQWSALGDGLRGSVLALAVLPDGSLVAGGNFYRSGETYIDKIARWDGVEWSGLPADPFPTLASSVVYSLKVLPDGRLLAGGWFDSLNDTQAAGIAVWDGTEWTNMSDGQFGYASEFALLADGTLIAAGRSLAEDIPFNNYVASWNGTTWTKIGAGFDREIRSLAVLTNGDLIAGGDFFSNEAGPTRFVARWDGSQWRELGDGVPPLRNESYGYNFVYKLAALPDGGFLVTGEFLGDVPPTGILQQIYPLLRWNGSDWAFLTPRVPGWLYAISTLDSGDMALGGFFYEAGEEPANSIVRWDGADTWTPLGTGTNGPFNAILQLPDGDLLVNGLFTSIQGVKTTGFARFDGSTWSPFGITPVSYVSDLALTPDGDIVATGDLGFTEDGLSIAVAVWDGLTWTPLLEVSYWNCAVDRVVVMPNGDIVVGGSDSCPDPVSQSVVNRWNGTEWLPMGQGLTGRVSALIIMPDGQLIAAGSIGLPGETEPTPIVRWDGSAWSPLGAGITGTAYGLVLTPDGGLLASTWSYDEEQESRYTTALYEWDGSEWSLFPGTTNGSYGGIVVLPNGDLVASARLLQDGSYSRSFLARWNGAEWTTLNDDATDYLSPAATLANGDLLLTTGALTLIEGQPSAHYAILSPGLYPPGDADLSGAVNIDDLMTVLAMFGSVPTLAGSPGDADRNGVVNFDDLTAVLANFGSACE